MKLSTVVDRLSDSSLRMSGATLALVLDEEFSVWDDMNFKL